MLRRALMDGQDGPPAGFRWRGREVSRIEGISDAVFGFSLTLLVVSLEVPRTFGELRAAIGGFLPFTFSFATLFLIWYMQYDFFRRYGLQDGTSLLLNAALLFVVVFFVYPLKFLMVWLATLLGPTPNLTRGPDGGLVPMLRTLDEARALLALYGVGFVVVFLLFALLYGHAYRHRAELELNALEAHRTRARIGHSLLNVALGLVSVGLAYLPGQKAMQLASMTYVLCAPGHALMGTAFGRRERARARAAQAAAPPVG